MPIRHKLFHNLKKRVHEYSKKFTHEFTERLRRREREEIDKEKKEIKYQKQLTENISKTFEVPKTIQTKDATETIDKMIQERPELSEALDQLKDYIARQIDAKDLSPETLALARRLVAEERLRPCFQKMRAMKLTPTTLLKLQQTKGTIIVTRYVRISKRIDAQLLERSRRVPENIILVLRRKPEDELYISRYTAGQTDNLQKDTRIATDITYDYRMFTNRLIDVILRPHTIRYYGAKAVGMAEEWLSFNHCSLYWLPKTSQRNTYLFNPNINNLDKLILIGYEATVRFKPRHRQKLNY
ncbi:MAG: hypothetical protein QW416_07995 [Candidatus Nitrosocaldaceae archaeon]